MAILKDITELPLTEATENLYFIVNENGSAKQFSGEKIIDKTVKAYIDGTYDEENQTYSYVLRGASYDDLKAAYDAGEMPNIVLHIFSSLVRCQEFYYSEDYNYLIAVFNSTFAGMGAENGAINIFPDGTVQDWTPM